jgi:hypothetical protein
VKLQAALHQQNCQKDMTLRELKELLNCPLLSKEDCFSIIQNKFQTTNYEFLSFKVTPLDEVNGFLGDYYKLQIKIRRQKEEIINCFVKCMPKGTASKQVVQDGSSFIKETFSIRNSGPEISRRRNRHYRRVLAGLLLPKTGRSDGFRRHVVAKLSQLFSFEAVRFGDAFNGRQKTGKVSR